MKRYVQGSKRAIRIWIHRSFCAHGDANLIASRIGSAMQFRDASDLLQNCIDKLQRSVDDLAPSVKGTPDWHRIKLGLAMELQGSLHSNGAESKVSLEKTLDLARADVSDEYAFQCALSVFARRHSKTLSTLSSRLGMRTVLHLSCKPRLDRARASCLNFRARIPELSQIIVVGDGKDGDFSYDVADSVLRVPAPDTYEYLPQKMAAAGLLLAFLPGLQGVLKVDDDHRLHNAAQLCQAFQVAERSGASQFGDVYETPMYGQNNRLWHYGKCSNVARHVPFTQFGPKRWANGGSGYILNKRGLYAMLWAFVYFPEAVEHSLYEDMLVSDINERFGTGVRAINTQAFLGAVTDY